MALGFITQRNTITSGAVIATLPVLDENFPADIEVAAGASATATFQCKITEDGTPTNYIYQWYKEGTAVDGANSAIYTLPAGSLNSAGSYSIYCTVTNDAGTVTSRVATLTAKIWKPTLNASLPANVSVTAGTGATATFSVGITTEGNPASYTYQWYLNGSTWPGQTNSTVSLASDWINTAVGSHSIYCIVTNEAGSVQSRVATLSIANWKPTYSYTGNAQLIDDGNYNWRIKFLTSGTLRFTSLGNASTIDVFCVGGGAGGSGSTNSYQPSGSGGYTTTTPNKYVGINVDYQIIIGAGGTGNSSNVNGGTSSAFSVSAAGGEKQKGGSGSCAYWNGAADNGYGSPGVDGGDGHEGLDKYGRIYGRGQHTTTREFGESGGTLYSSGGGNPDTALSGGPGGANTGNGGGSPGGYWPGQNGGSGIVVIRNHR